MFCTTLDVVVMTRHDHVIEPLTGLRAAVVSASALTGSLMDDRLWHDPIDRGAGGCAHRCRGVHCKRGYGGGRNGMGCG